MDDRTRSLLAARAMLGSAKELIDRLADDDSAPRSPDDREIVAVAAMVTEGLRSRSRADALRFVRAVKAGDEAWLVLRSIPGEHRVDAAYHARSTADLRRALG